MRLLVITQKVNKNDSNLGFFHEWLLRLAARVEHLYVICLEQGESDLPDNVTVLSLGKEIGNSKLKYVKLLFSYIWKYRDCYDSVFVHMNPEYVVLGGLFWRFWHKKILLWYVHKSVTLKLRLAALLTNKIFTASPESFRMRSKKVEVVGHGIPVEKFASQIQEATSHDQPLSLLAVGRVASSKNWETVIRALAEVLKNPALPVVAFSVIGTPITKSDYEYQNQLNKLGKEMNVELNFQQMQHDVMPVVYQKSHILIHTSQTGSVDKVVLEALAAGRIVVTSSEAYAKLADNELKGIVFRFPPGNYQELAKAIEKIYQSGILNQLPNQKAIEYVKQHHHLDTLIGKIINYFVVKQTL